MTESIPARLDRASATEDTDFAALVGPIAYREWQEAADTYKARLAAWARNLPSLTDDEFVAEAASAIHGSALTNSWRGNWNHEHFKASFAYHEAVRRHRVAGHGESCTGRTLYSVAHNQAARGQGYDWAMDRPCDGTCGIALAGPAEVTKEAQS